MREYIKRILSPLMPEDEKTSLLGRTRNFFLHWFPPRMRERSLSWSYSLWLGTASLVLFFITLITGIVLMFLYVPSVERAYLSIEDIENVFPYGWLLRAVHRWAGHLMVGAVFLHMTRVFYTAGYADSDFNRSFRRINWLVGVILLLLTLFLAFTGYLLPWDQLSLWAVTVATHIGKSVPWIGEKAYEFLIGGKEIGQNALIRFYTYHCIAVPVIVIFLIAYHLWRIRKDGGLACSENPHFSREIISNPNVTRRVLTVFLLTWTVTLMVGIFVRAPLLEPADKSWAPNPAKAPWYFLWLQELIAIFTIRIGNYTINGGFVGGVLIPGMFLLVLAIWPFIRRHSPEEIGTWWPRSRFWENISYTVVSLLIIFLIILAYFFRGPYWKLFWPWKMPPATGIM